MGEEDTSQREVPEAKVVDKKKQHTKAIILILLSLMAMMFLWYVLKMKYW